MGRFSGGDGQFYKVRAGNTYGFKCFFCKTPGDSNSLTLEHLIPVARGGSLMDIKNHALACDKCNNEKCSLTVEEYATMVLHVPVSNFKRFGKLKDGVKEIGPITNTVDLARFGLLR